MALNTESKAARLVRILEATVLVVATLYFGRPIFLPVVAAILLVFLLSPPVAWLERWRVPRPVAVLAVVLCLFSLFGLIAWTATIQLSQLVLELPKYQQNLHAKIQDMRGSQSGTLRKLGESIGQLTTEIQQSTEDSAAALRRTSETSPQPPTPVKIVADPTTPWEAANLAISSLAGPLASLGVLTVLVIFMLLVREDLRDRMLRLAGTNQLTLTTRTLDELGTRISRYLLLNALVNGGFGLIVGLGLFALGVQYAALWAVLAAIFRFIPYVGIFMAAAAPLAIAVAQFPGWTQPLLVIVLYLGTELLASNVIEPLVYGRGAGVSPVALILAAMFWSWIWGFPGLVLSIPLTVCIAVLGKYLPPLEPLWVLLGNEASLPPSVRYYQRLLANDVDEATDILDEYRANHTLVETFDDVLLPALAQAERDREHDDISDATQELIWNTTEQAIDDLAASNTDALPSDPASAPATPLTVFAVPVSDRADGLAIKMLSLTAPRQIRIQSTLTVMLAGELLAQLETDQPDLVCISALGPAGVSHVRYVCKRVSQGFPTLPLLVGRWAFRGNADKMALNTKQRGATYVVTELSAALEVLEKLSPRIRTNTPDPAPA